jgi:ABC-type bacteriocin/lantibiotic exporter with double-glycine peptidase domain
MKKLSVPLLKQGKLECGPTALRMVLKYFDRDASLKEITRGTGGIKTTGVRTVKLADFAKSLGFKVECYSCNKKLAKGKAKIKKPSRYDIVKFLKKRLPVIIAVRSFLLFNKKPSKMGHFIVITKYEKGKFWYNDPKDGKGHVINEEDLMISWLDNSVDSSAYLLVLEPNTKSHSIPS